MGTRSLIRMATVFYVIVAVGAWGLAVLFGNLDKLFGPAPAAGMHVAVGVVTGLVIVALCHFANALVPPVERASRLLGAFFGPIRAHQAVYLAVLSGFSEELLFRGALWEPLGLLWTSVLFGLLHTVPVRGLAGYPLFAALAGAAFGLLRGATASVWPCVVAHATVNAFNLAWLGAMEQRRRDAESDALPDLDAPRGKAEYLPVDMKAADSFPITVWSYELRVDLKGTDRESLPECLEHEDLHIFRFVEREEVYRQLRGGRLAFGERFRDPFAGFPADIATLSVYLSQSLTGIEVASRFVSEDDIDEVRAWKIVAQRGEWVKVPLVVGPRENGQFIVDREGEDVEVLAAHWAEYPRWFQDGMRFKYAQLREL